MAVFIYDGFPESVFGIRGPFVLCPPEHMEAVAHQLAAVGAAYRRYPPPKGTAQSMSVVSFSPSDLEKVRLALRAFDQAPPSPYVGTCSAGTGSRPNGYESSAGNDAPATRPRPVMSPAMNP